MNKVVLSKKHFLRLIKEGKNINEMAQHPGASKKPIIMGDEGEQQLIGWDIRTNDENPEEDRLKLLFTCDLEGFKERNPNFAQIIQNELGEGVDWRIVSTLCPGEDQFSQGKKPSEPRRKDYYARKLSDDLTMSPEGGQMMDLTQKTTGVSRTESEAIRIKLYNVLRKELQENEALNNRFKMLQIPKIIISRENADRYVDPDTNNLISFGTHTSLLHRNIDTFIDSTVSILAGDEDYVGDTILTYLARQYNRINQKKIEKGESAYANWNLGRLSNIKKTGLTPVYKLNRLGFEQDDYGVITVGKFRLKGQKFNHAFTWNIEFEVKFGLLKQGENEVHMFNMYKNVMVQDSANLPMDFDVPLGKTILDVEEVYNSLMEILDKFENEILTLNPQSALERANLDQYDRENQLAFADELHEIEFTKGKLLEQIMEAMGGETTSGQVDTDIEKYDDFMTKGDKSQDDDNENPQVSLQLAKDQNGRFFVMTSDPKNPKIIAKFS